MHILWEKDVMTLNQGTDFVGISFSRVEDDAHQTLINNQGFN